MIIAALQHGLGNQLFQYATARAVAERAHAPLWFDTTHYRHVRTRGLDLRKLSIQGHFLPDALAGLLAPDRRSGTYKAWLKSAARRGVRTLHDQERGYDPRIASAGWFSRLDGLWQSERYFAHLRPQLLNEMEVTKPLSPPVAKMIERARDEPSVALHVRRSDLVTDTRYAETVGTLEPAYYEEALTRLKEVEPDARGYVFTDDPGWCRDHLAPVLPCEIVSGALTRTAVEDFAVMKACRHFIIANSTFSWWTAWLGKHPEKHVIAPARFFRVPRAWEVDLLPPEWEKLEPVFAPNPSS